MGISLSPEYIKCIKHKNKNKNRVNQFIQKDLEILESFVGNKDRALTLYKEELNRKIAEAKTQADRGELVSLEDAMKSAKNVLLKYKKQD